MASAGNKGVDDQDVASSSKKPRRSIIRSLSWKRSKRTKMEENNGQSFEDSEEIDITVRRFGKNGDTHEMSDDEGEEGSDLDKTGQSSQKRKRFGVWKAMKRIFRRRSSKNSKSFTEGDSNSPQSRPTRSLSDPNLLSRSDRPELAPLEEVRELPLRAEASTPVPKKAVSHDSLMSELRSKHIKNIGNVKDEKTSPNKKAHAIVSLKHQGVDWQVRPGSPDSEKLVPGLSASHDKIRVAPRHRRAPTRRGMASVRHADRQIKDTEVIPRSYSVGATSPIHEQNKQRMMGFEEVKETLQLPEEGKHETKKEEIEEGLSSEKMSPEDRIESLQSVSEDQEKSETTELDITEESTTYVSGDSGTAGLVEDIEREEERKSTDFKELMESLRPSQEEKVKFDDKSEEIILEAPTSVFGQNQTDNIKEERNVSQNQKHELSTLQGNAVRDETSRMEVTIVPVEAPASEERKEAIPSQDYQQTVEKSLEESKPSEHQFLPVSAAEPETKHGSDTTNGGFSLSEDVVVNVPKIVGDPRIGDPEETVPESPSNAPAIEISAPSVEPIIETEPTPISETISGTVQAGPLNQFLEPTLADVSVPALVSVAPEIPDMKSDPEEAVSKAEVEDASAIVLLSDDESSEASISSPTKKVHIQEPKSDEPLPLVVAPASPVRRKRLNVEMPENVFHKSVLPEIKRRGSNDQTSSQRSEGIQRRRPQSCHEGIQRMDDGEGGSKDDSSAGVAKLTQAFERSYRANTISYGERRKKPDILPKPKIATAKTDGRQNDKSKTLERNYRFPVTAKKSVEASTKTAPKRDEQQTTLGKNDDTVVITAKRSSLTDKSETAAKSPTKKPEKEGRPNGPKPLPKPKIKKDVKPVVSDESKENIKELPKPVRNGSARTSVGNSVRTEQNVSEGSSEGSSEVAMPSFWAKRNMFAPKVPDEKHSGGLNSSGLPEKTKEVPKHSPLIQLKTDTCAVCGSKVYQMEKFKVKDNIVHRSCIKCSVCKRLLSVGNFIMSKNKIYCKPHEPRITITLST